MIDLPQKSHGLIKTILKQNIPDHLVWAFGSRINGTARKFSDIDLAIVSPNPLPEKVMISLKMAFEESNLPIHVDILEYCKLDETFRKIIDAQHIVFK